MSVSCQKNCFKNLLIQKLLPIVSYWLTIFKLSLHTFIRYHQTDIGPVIISLTKSQVGRFLLCIYIIQLCHITYQEKNTKLQNIREIINKV